MTREKRDRDASSEARNSPFRTHPVAHFGSIDWGE